MIQLHQVPKIGVAAWVIQDGKTLLGKRKNAHGEDTWACPGGHLEFGETPYKTAERELKEETNLSAQKILTGPWTNDLFLDQNKHYLTLHLFITEFSGMVQAMEPDKCTEWKWFELDGLPDHLFSSLNSLFRQATLKEHLAKAQEAFSIPTLI